MQQPILILTDWFYPGYKAGGIIRTCYNLVRLLEDRYSIHVITTDRDLGDAQPYDGIVANEWVQLHSFKIYYASPDKLTWQNIRQQIEFVNANTLFINSMFSKHFTVWPLLMKRMGQIKPAVVVSPNGMLKVAALQMKPLKKKAFLSLLKLLGGPKLFSFHASDDAETLRIKAVFGERSNIWQIFNPPPPIGDTINILPKQPGKVKLAFIGRVHPIKNLHFLLSCLPSLSQQIDLTIVGPIEDKAYYNDCTEIVKRLPGNITVSFTGEVTHEKVTGYLQNSHFMILPSLGENYCYAVVESFCAARPVIISDQTPWRNLTAKKAGWDLPLKEEAFVEVIQLVANMNEQEYRQWSTAARELAIFINNSSYKAEYIQLFDNAKMPAKKQ